MSSSDVGDSLINVRASSLGGMWGAILFWTMVSCGTIHGIFGLVVSARLALHSIKFLFVPLIFFIIGVVYTFVRCAVLSLAVALVHLALQVDLQVGELTFYVFALSLLCLFFSAGRITNIYAM